MVQLAFRPLSPFDLQSGSYLRYYLECVRRVSGATSKKERSKLMPLPTSKHPLFRYKSSKHRMQSESQVQKAMVYHSYTNRDSERKAGERTIPNRVKFLN